jgi:DNA binding domain, excisionase family
LTFYLQALKEFCDLTKISTSTAYRMIKNGSLPAKKLNGGRYWKITTDLLPTYNPDTGRIGSYFR